MENLKSAEGLVRSLVAPLLKETVTRHSYFERPDGNHIIVLECATVSKPTRTLRLLGIESEPKKVKKIVGKQTCDYCHEEYTIKRMRHKKPWRRYCKKQSCRNEYGLEWHFKNELKKQGADVSNL